MMVFPKDLVSNLVFFSDALYARLFSDCDTLMEMHRSHIDLHLSIRCEADVLACIEISADTIVISGSTMITPFLEVQTRLCLLQYWKCRTWKPHHVCQKPALPLCRPSDLAHSRVL